MGTRVRTVRHAGDERGGALGHDVRGCRAGDRVRHTGDERGGALDGERAVKAGDGERASPFVDGVADAACPGTAPAVARPGAAAARAAISRRIRGGHRSRGRPTIARKPRPTSPAEPVALGVRERNDATRRCATEEGQRPRLVPRIAPRGSRGRGCSRRRSTTRRRCRRPLDAGCATRRTRDALQAERFDPPPRKWNIARHAGSRTDWCVCEPRTTNRENVTYPW